MISVFGKVAIGDAPGQKATKEEVVRWKTSPAMIEARKNLRQPVDTAEDADPHDTYIRRIMINVWKNDHSEINQEFAIAVIDMMFDPTITTTSLTGDEIEGRMQARATQPKKMETEDSEEDPEEVYRTLERISFINLTSNLHIFEIIYLVDQLLHSEEDLEENPEEDPEEDPEEVCRTIERTTFINLTSNLHIFEI